MEKITGVNLGNWLVLEKWMQPSLFEGTGAEDEIWLGRRLSPSDLTDKMKAHRDTYVTEEDFAFLHSVGISHVRIPVPYFIFGDRPPYIGCIEYLDRAFDWAEQYDMTVLIDLHTVPGSQNGYDNGGITGVCKWCTSPKEVEFALTVLERLAERYAHRRGLFGIEVLNEPISLLVYLTAPSTGKAVDKEEAKGSGYVPMKFLRPFYRKAYKRIRAKLPEDKAIVFHDGFRLSSWNKFFRESDMKNVYLDTHIYIQAMENFLPIHKLWLYKAYMGVQKIKLARVQKAVPVIVGEWCISTRYGSSRVGDDFEKSSDLSAYTEAKERYRDVARIQLETWDRVAGYYFWNYQLIRDMDVQVDSKWKLGWDFRRCVLDGWMERFPAKGAAAPGGIGGAYRKRMGGMQK